MGTCSVIEFPPLCGGEGGRLRGEDKRTEPDAPPAGWRRFALGAVSNAETCPLAEDMETRSFTLDCPPLISVR